MSKRCQKESKKHLDNERSDKNVNDCTNGHKSTLSSVIGSANVDRWNQTKASLCCNTEEEFVTLLLDIAEKHIVRNKLKNENKNVKSHDKNEKGIKESLLHSHSVKKRDHKHKRKKSSRNSDKLSVNNENATKLSESTSIVPSNDVLTDHEKSEPKLVSEESPPAKEINVAPIKNSIVVNIANELLVPLELHKKIKIPNLSNLKTGMSGVTITPIKIPISNQEKPKKNAEGDRKSKKYDYDIRKAPELVKQNDAVSLEVDNVKSENSADNHRLAIKIKLCSNCGTRHLQEQCPLLKPSYEIHDSFTQNDWMDKYNDLYNSEKLNLEQIDIKPDEPVMINKFSYAYMSLPNALCYEETNTPHGLGVFAKTELEEFTQFGPLLGNIIKEVDIPEDCNMRDLFELSNENEHIYFSTENFAESNWLRFIRPAPTRDNRNLLVVARENSLYFVTLQRLKVGEELLYWQDDTVAYNKKKMEKTTCGGCNMNFLHPLYYRIHCSVFHDVRYSLTIRKYHCKVCGAAVLGKENIMKHAMELHNGQGAYQCQFCKKFFLRLNYLEMHRTYGCSANPHRSRPLCDFCGRKFCQPQKLKVHIKRMHSDMAEVLKEFQCKNCLKILGSRAALQRHIKEVHQKQMDGACACNRCGKLFQNKSNLKIHMLTHSGIKPFKCIEKNCVAAFTTKQCLQFHYKKVHGYTEDMMPKIERSVDYTFEAYSGSDDIEVLPNNQQPDDVKMMCESDQEDSLDDRNIDEPPALHSPAPIQPNDHSSNSTSSPPTLEAYAPNMKILSKGSKKWIAEDTQLKSEIYPLDIRKSEPHLDVEEVESYNSAKLNTNINSFSRHESSNASLLVEAALDSVCSEPNIDIDVSTTPNCTDTLVNNLYTLSHTDTLADVTYSHSVDVNDSRDINLISPSVNDQISVTDDINDELRQTQNIGIDYSSFHHDDFSPPNSPSRSNFVRDYINVNSPQNPHNYDAQTKNISPTASPPRYDFGPTVTPESDDSNGLAAQNLSLHNTKDGIQLDLSIYKSHYNFDNPNFIRKDMRSKFEEHDRKQVYILDVQKNYNEETNKFGLNVDTNHENLESDLTDKDFESIQDTKHKDDLDLSMRSNLTDIRNKFDLDLDLRKSYDIDSEIRRNTYEGSLDDFRMKNYDLDNLEIRNTLERNKTYESLMEDFRTDRNFEPLVLNPSELQGLDMSARSYHNYSNLNRYHHLYSEVDRPTVDLRLNYSPPPPSYPHADILRVVSLDLTPPGRHSVDLSLRSHQIANSRLLSEHTLQSTPHRLALDQSRLLSTELSTSRHLSTDSRLISDMSNRILSDHTTNRILSNDQLSTNRLITSDQRIITDDARLISDQPRLLDQSRLLGDGRILPPAPASGSISPVPYSGYSVSSSPYHPTALAPRPHATSPNPPSYHHYSAYY